MTRKRLITLPILLIVLLSAIGVSYAAWFDTITIVGTAQTGELEFLFWWREPIVVTEAWEVTPYHKEIFPDLVVGSLMPGEWLDKPIASTNAYYDGEVYLCPTCACPEDGDYGPNEDGLYGYEFLVIEVDNAYPGYIALTQFRYWNPGSIPLEIAGLDFVGTKDCEPVYDLIWDDSGDYTGDIYEDKDGVPGLSAGDGDPIARIEITIPAQTAQVDPCSKPFKDEIDIYFYQPIEECCTYTFKFRLKAIQWNKLYEADTIDWPWPVRPIPK